jgi:aspartyl protease family protein
MLLAIVIIGAGIFVFTNRPMIYDLIGFHPSDMVSKNQTDAQEITEVKAVAPKTMAVSGSAAFIPKADDGQFWTEARVNTTTIRFLVDTGASIVVLTPLDAQKAGIRPDDLVYNAPVNTAAGQVMAAPVQIDIISVGNVTVRDVRGVVIPDGLTQSLLGMSFLGELQKVEATRSALILRQ